MLSGVMYDVGQLVSDTLPRTQTIADTEPASCASQPHRRFFSRPLFLQESHFQAALFPS